ncbi:uncharacterized protein LOC144459431 [Epinephelus lanceolatus]
MKLADFLLLLFLTDGSTSSYSEHTELDDQQKSNQSFGEGGNTSVNSNDYVDYTDNNKDKVDSEVTCSYQDVVNYLNLTKNKELYTTTRPVTDYKQTTKIHIQMSIYGILDVREIDQTFVTNIWVYMVSFFSDESILKKTKKKQSFSPVHH